MKIATFALTLTVLGGLALVGCNSGSSSSDTPPVAPSNAPVSPDMAGAPMSAGAPTGLAPKPGAGGVTAAGGGLGKGGQVSSFDAAPESMKKLWGGGGGMMPGAGSGMPTGMPGGMPGAGGGDAGAKPAPIRPGAKAVASRKDPFESMIKDVVQISPAWDYVLDHRTQAPLKPVEEIIRTGDPDIDLPPLPPVSRRIAGVFYNGGITAILESGNPPDSDITIVQPGALVDSQVPGVGQLVVESITMDGLILRAKDGRTVEVKISGLAPAVRDALRQQFSNTNGGVGGMGPGGMGPGGPAGMGSGGGAKGGGGASGSNGAPIQ